MCHGWSSSWSLATCIQVKHFCNFTRPASEPQRGLKAGPVTVGTFLMPRSSSLVPVTSAVDWKTNGSFTWLGYWLLRQQLKDFMLLLLLLLLLRLFFRRMSAQNIFCCSCIHLVTVSFNFKGHLSLAKLFVSLCFAKLRVIACRAQSLSGSSFGLAKLLAPYTLYTLIYIYTHICICIYIAINNINLYVLWNILINH